MVWAPHLYLDNYTEYIIMYNMQTIINQYLQSKNRGNFCRHLPLEPRTHIQELTNFLPVKASWGQRLWHICNNNWNIPKCPECSSTVRWISANGKYSVYCSLKCSNNSSKVKILKEQTCETNRGTKYPTQHNDVKLKVKQTCQRNYGVDNPFKSPEIQNNIKQTNIELYGVDNPFKSPEIQNNIKISRFKSTGIYNQSQSHMIDILKLIQDFNWLYYQYIVLGKTAVKISDELGISDVTIGNYLKQHEITIRHSYNFSQSSIHWLESIIQEEQIFIQHAGNIGEYKIPGTRYSVDGYCKETNTCYEFHGDYWHGNPTVYHPDYYNNSCYKTMGELYQQTIDREHYIKQLGYHLIIMWENDWNLINT